MSLKDIIILLSVVCAGFFSNNGIGVNGIYRGRNAGREKFLWIAQIRDAESNLLCHGVLISSQWALTLASCVKNDVVHDVVVGDYDRSVIGDGEEIATVKRVILHPQNSYLVNNIALIEFNASVNVSSPSIEPMTNLASTDDDDELSTTTRKCQIAGWGEKIERGTWTLSNVLQELKVQKEEDSICAGLGLTKLQHYSCFKMVKFHSGACPTDQGTPVLYNINGNTVLVGLMYGQFSVDGCVGGVKIVSKASSFKTWIKEYVPDIE